MIKKRIIKIAFAYLSIRYVTQVPIRFISTGEKMKDLEPFHPDRLAKRILDMGDVVSLVEKAQEVVDEKEAEKMMKRLENKQFSINDFVKQMEQISKLETFFGHREFDAKSQKVVLVDFDENKVVNEIVFVSINDEIFSLKPKKM
jgi:hypothetical protein